MEEIEKLVFDHTFICLKITVLLSDQIGHVENYCHIQSDKKEYEII